MPSHIFNRLGLWQDSINTNEASARVAAAWMKEGRAGSFDEFHASNNIEYACLQLSDDKRARSIIEQTRSFAAKGDDTWLSTDARIYYDLETHNWKDAVQIEPPQFSPFEENFDAYWIEAVGAARLGDPIKARSALKKYRESETAWTKDHGWGDILGVGLGPQAIGTLAISDSCVNFTFDDLYTDTSIGNNLLSFH